MGNDTVVTFIDRLFEICYNFFMVGDFDYVLDSNISVADKLSATEIVLVLFPI